MSETVKLIVEISKETYLELREGKIVGNAITSAEAIGKGIPLDDVKLKIEQDMSLDMFNDYGNETAIHKELWEILDNIGKGE